MKKHLYEPETKETVMKKYTAILRPGESGWIVVECAELPGAISQGKTRKEALANIKEAIEGILECMADRNQQPPAMELVTVSVHEPRKRQLA